MGIPQYAAKRYEDGVRDGGILVSVHDNSSEELSKANELLKKAVAEESSSSGEKVVGSHRGEREVSRPESRI